MKIQQPKTQYSPITIKLEKRGEAEAFFNIIDKIERSREDGEGIALTASEISLVVDLSNARGGEIVI